MQSNTKYLKSTERIIDFFFSKKYVSVCTLIIHIINIRNLVLSLKLVNETWIVGVIPQTDSELYSMKMFCDRNN